MFDSRYALSAIAAASCIALSLGLDYLIVQSLRTTGMAHKSDGLSRGIAIAFSLLVLCKVALWTMY